MSSDFETLSCNLESSEPRRRCCRSSSMSSTIGSDFDTLDDLVAHNDAQLPRRLAARNSAPDAGARRALSGDHAGAHSGRRESALYGYRPYGVAGEFAATSPAAGSGGGGKMPLFAKGPTTCRLPPTTVAHKHLKTMDSLANLGSAFTPTVVAPRASGATATPGPTTTAAHDSAFRGREPALPIERRVTCPPDFGSLTSVTSTATMTASDTTCRTHDSANDDSSEGDGGAVEDRADLKGGHTVQRRRLARDAPVAAVASRTPKPTPRAPPHRNARDFDGFYNTGLLLEEDDDDDDAAESERSRRPARAVDGAAAPLPSAALNASLFYMYGPAGRRGSDASISFRRSQPATATPDPHTEGHSKGLASPMSVNASTVTAARSWSIALRREAAGEQLCRLAVALPTMTTVHWLSLVITLLVPVNLLCLDVMALGWIRRRVDASYGGASVLPSSDRSTAPTSLRVVICGAAGVSTGVAEAPSSCANDSGFTFKVGATTFTPTPGGGGSGRSSSSSSTSSNTAGPGNPRRIDAKTSSLSSTHTVPALCSVILWLLAPNGLLCRLVIHRLRRPTDEAVADDHEPVDESGVDLSPSLVGAAAAPSTPSPGHRAPAASTDEYHHLRTEWQVCCDVYERVRQLAPQLEVIELFIRYACLWVMLHAPLPCATVASKWTDAWLLKAPAPEEGKAIAPNGSHWRAASNATASVSPRRAADVIVAA